MKYNKRDFITESEEYFYWKNNNFKNKMSAFRKYFQFSIKFILEHLFNLEIRKKISHKLENRSYLLKTTFDKYTSYLLAKKIQKDFSKINIFFKSKELRQKIIKFRNFFFKQTFNLEGGLGFNNSLLLYLYINKINPDLVVESGVWRGFTTKIIDEATDNKCKILCFDINLSLVKYKSKKAEYYEHDIKKFNIEKKYKKILAFFDDHYSHYDRLVYSLKNNIGHIVLDDDVSFLNVHADGTPPIPTANMIFNYYISPKKFKWISNGRAGSANLNNLNYNIIDKIKNKYLYYEMSDFRKITGYENGSFTSFFVCKKKFSKPRS